MSLQERLNRAFAAQEVENIKTRHAYLHAKSHSFAEWNTLWAYTDDVTWAHSFGRMVGWDEMYYGSVEKYDRDMLDLYNTMVKKNPHIIGKDFLACCLGGLHSLASGVIEVAEDGQSARSFFLTPGTLCACNMPSGVRDGAMCWERYGSDFVYRDGRWWWFHEQVCPDIGDSYDDSNWAQDRFRKYMDGSLNVGNCSGPPASGISDLREAHNDISIIQTVQDTVPAPAPYEKLDEENTYSPGCAEFENIPIYPARKGFSDPVY